MKIQVVMQCEGVPSHCGLVETTRYIIETTGVIARGEK